MVRYLTEDDVLATFTMADALRALRAAASAQAEGKAMNEPRRRLSAGAAMLNVLPAALDGRVGLKTYTIAPRGPRFWFTLYAAGGELLAIIEANHLGQIRTGAASGLATQVLAREDAAILGIIGSGFQARTQLEAVCAVRQVRHAFAYGRDRERLHAFCAEMHTSCGIPVTAAASARDAVAEADVVCTVTNAAQPVLEGRWLKAGVHVNAVGSNRLSAQEIDVEAVRRAALVVVEDVAQAKVESGDLRVATEAGAFRWLDAIRLADLVAGSAEGRRSPEDITLFKSLGIGLWDIAAANHIYDVCTAAGRGQEIAIPA